MQVPRPEPERRRHAEAVAQRQARALQVVASFFGRIDERLQRDVVAGLDVREQRFDVVEAGGLGRAGGQDLCRRLLRRRHVRLVERIDAEHPSRKRRRELPAEELGAEVPGTPVRQNDDRLVAHRGLLAVRHEETIVAVGLGHADVLTDHRQDPRALLAGRFGDQLLDPVAERRDRLGQHDRQLVSPRARGLPDRGAEPRAGVLLHRYCRVARARHLLRGVEQLKQRRADQRGRDQAEQR